MENDEPKRQKLRSDREEPRCKKSSTDKELPNATIP
jgi:hypothetical protein